MLGFIKGRVALVTGALAALMLTAAVIGAGSASAVADDPVTPAFTDAGTKVALYGGAMIGLVLIGLGIALGVKYLSKGFHRA